MFPTEDEDLAKSLWVLLEIMLFVIPPQGHQFLIRASDSIFEQALMLERESLEGVQGIVGFLLSASLML